MINENKSKKNLIVLAGPTAVGKTDMSIQVAQKLNTEIISADSRQIFKEMNIGTAVPSQEQLQAVPHHMIQTHSIFDGYNAGQYESDVIALLNRLFEKREHMVLTGGTGLYLQSIINGLDDFPEVPSELTKKIDDLYQEKGLEALQEKIKKYDPDYAAQVDLSNHRRLIRALSIIEVSGQSYSSFLNQSPKKRSFTCTCICLYREREDLYGRINKRVDVMIDKGLEQEARILYPYRHLSALDTVGYREWFSYFDGTIDRKEAIRLIKRNTRRYAKRQMTWFKNQGTWKMINANRREDLFRFLEDEMGLFM